MEQKNIKNEVELGQSLPCEYWKGFLG